MLVCKLCPKIVASHHCVSSLQWEPSFQHYHHSNILNILYVKVDNCLCLHTLAVSSSIRKFCSSDLDTCTWSNKSKIVYPQLKAKTKHNNSLPLQTRVNTLQHFHLFLNFLRLVLKGCVVNSCLANPDNEQWAIQQTAATNLWASWGAVMLEQSTVLQLNQTLNMSRISW